MKTNRCFLSARRPASGIQTRLWMLAVVAVLFSLMWPLAGALKYRYTCCVTPEKVPTNSVVPGLPGVLVRTANDQRFVVDSAGIKSSHHPRSPALVPVSFHVSDLAIPLESERVFSYRQIDEFLRHQANLTAGARVRDNGQDGEGVDVEDIQIF